MNELRMDELLVFSKLTCQVILFFLVLVVGPISHFPVILTQKYELPTFMAPPHTKHTTEEQRQKVK